MNCWYADLYQYTSRLKFILAYELISAYYLVFEYEMTTIDEFTETK